MSRRKPARLTFLLFVALSIGGTISVPTLEATATTTAVTWTVDHAAKTITVTANIAFFAKPPTKTPFQQQRFEASVARVKKAIEAAWNGHQFKCYALVVKVNAHAVQGQKDVHDNEVPVGFDVAVYPSDPSGAVDRSRSFVRVSASSDDYLSDSPQFNPTTGANSKASEWSFEAPDGVYAHEFGHILGLSDNYVEGKWTLKEGAADDLMNESGAPVSEASITKAVRRSGQVDEKSIKCPMLIDLPTSTIGLPGFAGGTIALHGCTPDYDPESTDTTRPAKMTFHGKVEVSADALTAAPYLGSAAASGTADFQSTWTSPSPTVDIDIGGGSHVVQQLEATAQGPVSEAEQATIKGSSGEFGLGNTVVFTDYDGPCQ